jgi:hypothetical protein
MPTDGALESTSQKSLYKDAVFEEYRMLRAEIKQRQSNMIAVITGAVGANGIMLKLAFDLMTIPTPNKFYVLIFLFWLIPGMNLIMLLVMLFEVAQMMQFGNFSLYLEEKINFLVGDLPGADAIALNRQLRGVEEKFGLEASEPKLVYPLTWEQWLRAMKKGLFPPKWTLNRFRAHYSSIAGHLAWMYIFRIAIFFVFAGLSWYLGWHYSSSADLVDKGALKVLGMSFNYWTWTPLAVLVLFIIVLACAIMKSSAYKKSWSPIETDLEHTQNH